jgi:hypothetical protein
MNTRHALSLKPVPSLSFALPLPIFPFSHLLIFPSSHLPIFPFSHFLIFSSSHLPIFPSSHLPIFPFSNLPILNWHNSPKAHMYRKGFCRHKHCRHVRQEPKTYCRVARPKDSRLFLANRHGSIRLLSTHRVYGVHF